MAIRVGINGFGRIGRNFFRAQQQLGADIDIVAANDLGDAKTMAHLLRYDSTLGPFAGEVELGEGVLRAGGEELQAAVGAGSGGASVEGPGRGRRARVDGVLHRSRRCAEAPGRGCEEGSHLRPGDRPGPDGGARGERRRLRPRAAPHRLERLVHDELRRAAREGRRRPRRHRVGLHDHDPRVHAGSDAAGRSAQGLAARPGGRDQPRPDLDRGREGDRARPPAPPGEGGRHLRPRPGPDRLADRPGRHARPRRDEGRGQRRVLGGCVERPARARTSSTPRLRSSRPTSSATATRASSTAS